MEQVDIKDFENYQITDDGKKVYQYELDGTLVATYSSIMDAEKLNPTFDHSRISKCCKGKNKTHKGYKWSYKPL